MTILYSILGVYAALCILAVIMYLPKIRQYFSAFRKPKHIIAKEKRRISLVIPARNESAIIPDLLDSIAKQDYDKDYFSVNIIVKEPTDPTIGIAKKFGANVFVVSDQNCKGAALDGYFHAIRKEEFERHEAFVVVDADAVLAPNYITELNNALEYDKDIYNTRKLIKNYLGDRKTRSFWCNLSALTYPIIDDLGNAYRGKKNIPLNLCGQGLMVRKRAIEKLGGWPYRSMTEDYELRMDGYLKDLTGMYYPYAEIYSEEAVSHKEVYTRRMRWLTGYSQCDKKYMRDIKKKIKTEKSSFALTYDMLCYKIAPALFFVATVLTMFCGCLLTWSYSSLQIEAWIYLFCIPFAVLYLTLFLYTLMAMWCYRDVFKKITFGEKLAILFFHPFYLLQYVPIYVKSRFKAVKGFEWKQTERVIYEKKA